MLDSTTIPDGYKKCSKCGIVFPASGGFFHADKTKKYGLASSCKTCAIARAHRHYRDNFEHHKKLAQQRHVQNRERDNAYYKQWYQNHKEQQRIYGIKYREEHQESIKAQKKRDYQDNRQVRIEKTQKWRRDNPERLKQLARIWSHRRRARAAKAEGGFSYCDITNLYYQQRGRCWWCGGPLNDTYHVDHRFPLARGGSNQLDNLCLSCPTCNCSKGAKMPWEWCGRLL